MAETQRLRPPPSPNPIDTGRPYVKVDETVEATIANWQAQMVEHHDDYGLDTDPMFKVYRIKRSAEVLLGSDPEAHPRWLLRFRFTVVPSPKTDPKGRDRVKSLLSRSSKSSHQSWILSGHFELQRVDGNGRAIVDNPFVPQDRHTRQPWGVTLDRVPLVGSRGGVATEAGVTLHSVLHNRNYDDLWRFWSREKQALPAIILHQEGRHEGPVMKSTYRVQWALPNSAVKEAVEYLEVDRTNAKKLDKKKTEIWSREEITVIWSRA